MRTITRLVINQLTDLTNPKQCHCIDCRKYYKSIILLNKIDDMLVRYKRSQYTECIRVKTVQQTRI
jgi:hypothetical protein